MMQDSKGHMNIYFVGIVLLKGISQCIYGQVIHVCLVNVQNYCPRLFGWMFILGPETVSKGQKFHMPFAVVSGDLDQVPMK